MSFFFFFTKHASWNTYCWRCDSHCERVTGENIYRFSAIEIDLEDVGMFHGVNERVSCDNLLKLSLFYEDIIARVVLMDPSAACY